ncbi:MAG: hypothetical protein KHX42_04435 [Prevotella sp.]|nr:hypothetical protein [Prevotella sp.]
MDTRNITQKRCTNSATDYNWTHKIAALKKNTYILLQGLVAVTMLWSCSSKIDTPADTKYLADFHAVNFMETSDELPENEMALYVDYSTCNVLGQNSQLFQQISASLITKTTHYFSIKGSEITEEDLNETPLYTRLQNINEVNYAELKEASMRMANSKMESVMITDGEYYTPSIAKGHDNDPYLTPAFKTWLLRGYDVYIISEPYVEPYNGKTYNKKRFYILFTDDTLPNNIYSKIIRTVNFENHPNVDIFHLSVSHPRLKGDGDNSSTQNEVLESKTKGYGTFEIEDWDGCDWNTIEETIVSAMDDDGNNLSNGLPIIKMGIDRNSFGCYRMKALDLKVYNINEKYNEFYNTIEANKKPCGINCDIADYEIENFMLIDEAEFNKHSKINIHFNQDWFNPNILDGSPYNYFKVDLVIKDVQSIFDQHESLFEFESITMPGQKNVSVASSIKQCIADDEIMAKMIGQTIYSIYIKSEAK